MRKPDLSDNFEREAVAAVAVHIAVWRRKTQAMGTDPLGSGLGVHKQRWAAFIRDNCYGHSLSRAAAAMTMQWPRASSLR